MKLIKKTQCVREHIRPTKQYWNQIWIGTKKNFKNNLTSDRRIYILFIVMFVQIIQKILYTSPVPILKSVKPNESFTSSCNCCFLGFVTSKWKSCSHKNVWLRLIKCKNLNNLKSRVLASKSRTRLHMRTELIITTQL